MLALLGRKLVGEESPLKKKLQKSLLLGKVFKYPQRRKGKSGQSEPKEKFYPPQVSRETPPRVLGPARRVKTRQEEACHVGKSSPR